MTSQELGERLRKAAHARELTVKSIADKAGVSYPYAAAVFRGENNPTIGMLGKIVGSMSMSLGEFFADGNAARVRSRRPDKELERMKKKLTEMEGILVKHKLITPF